MFCVPIFFWIAVPRCQNFAIRSVGPSLVAHVHALTVAVVVARQKRHGLHAFVVTPIQPPCTKTPNIWLRDEAMCAILQRSANETPQSPDRNSVDQTPELVE